MSIQLPEAFCSRMKEMLGAKENEDFLKSYENPRELGLRVNTGKITCQEFEQIVPFPVERIPWVDNGYFYQEDIRPARSPYYQAGLYYLQEPSAMTPASRIPIVPGEYVLDLCAAPGGKATALGARLQGKGLLVANDISTTRARALLRNLELFGISNAFVTNEPPSRLVPAFQSFFHKIILDAPCSGEGMFRKEEAMAADWSPQKSQDIAKIQRELICQAVEMLRPGGLLLYSTCTFAPIENEGTISHLLEQHPEMELLEIPPYQGFSPGVPAWGNGDSRLARCVRIFPHKMNGEGHFLALIKKPGVLDSPIQEAAQAVPTKERTARKPGKARRQSDKTKGGSLDQASASLILDFFRETGISTLGGYPLDVSRMELRGEKIYLLPDIPRQFRGITFLRNGLYLGDRKKDRFEPAQPLALALHKGECSCVLSLNVNDPRLAQYFKGETISVENQEASCKKGWLLVCVEGYPLGWGKLVGQTVKNKYPAGWRI